MQTNSNLESSQSSRVSVLCCTRMSNQEILKLMDESKKFWVHQGTFEFDKDILINEKYTTADSLACLKVALELARLEKAHRDFASYYELKFHVIKICKYELGSGYPSPDMIYFNPDTMKQFRNLLNKAIAL